MDGKIAQIYYEIWNASFTLTGTINCHKTVRIVSGFSTFCADLHVVEIHYIFVKYSPKVYIYE